MTRLCRSLLVPLTISSGVALHALAVGGASREAPVIVIERPLPDERFVAGERVTFKASFRGVDSAHHARAVWTSSLTGELGRGAAVDIGKLSPGPQDVTWQDGSQPDERWTVYDPAVFALESPRPSKSVLPAKVDVFRHQVFDEPRLVEAILAWTRRWTTAAASRGRRSISCGSTSTARSIRRRSRSGRGRRPGACFSSRSAHPRRRRTRRFRVCSKRFWAGGLPHQNHPLGEVVWASGRRGEDGRARQIAPTQPAVHTVR